MSLPILFSATFILSLVIALMMIRINVADIPNTRSSHIRSTPRSGGIAIVLSFYVLLLWDNPFATPFKDSIYIWNALLISAGSFALLGFMDDLKSMKSLSRLPIQILIVILSIFSGLIIPAQQLFFMNDIALWIMGIITITWLVGFVNAFNFMDGLNGMSGGIAIIVLIFMSLLLQMTGESVFYKPLIILIAAIFGFFVLNFISGRIFMGDVGSLFLGFMLSSLSVLFTRSIFGGISFWTFIVLLFPYIFETTFTIGRRYLQRDNIFEAHKEHLYQLLHRTGWSHTKVVLLYYLFFLVHGGLAIFMQKVAKLYHPLFLIPCFAMMIFYTITTLKYVKHKKVLR